MKNLPKQLIEFTLEMNNIAKRQTSQGHLLLFLLSAVSLLLSLSAQRWLPEQFLRDSSLVNERVFGSVSGYADTFSIVSELYKLLAIPLNPSVLAFVQWGICIVPLLLISKIAVQPFGDYKTRMLRTYSTKTNLKCLHHAVQPPSTLRTWPVTYAERSEAR